MRIIFAGTPDFAAVALRALLKSEHEVVAVYTQPDRPVGRGRKLKAGPVKALALQHEIPVCQPLSLKEAPEQEQLKSWQADVMVVAAYGLLLPEAVLTIPRYGCLNIHASLLPRWRGAAPIQRAILAGDQETGITIMQMDVGLDTGDMLYKVSCPIKSDDTAGSLHDRLAELGATALLTVLGQVPDGLTLEKQDDELACYARKLDKAEARIDWQQPASQIARQVMAFNPWPVAQTQLGDRVIRLWQAHAVAETGSQQPGTVIQASKAGFDIACGEGRLHITSLQLPGGKAMDAAALLNGHPDLLTPGTILE